MNRRPLLAIDTATSRAVVAIGDRDGRVVAQDLWPAGQRHSEDLLPRIDALLRAAEVRIGELGGIVVGIGPGAFTGLRVGLATAKTLAHELGRPIAGVSSAEALLHAAALASTAAGVGAGAPGSSRVAAYRPVLMLPAGSTDRIIVRAGDRPALLPGGQEPQLEPGESVVAVDLDGRADPDAVARGVAALSGLPAALLGLGAKRIVAGQVDDVAMLVPEYVTLPRGITQATGAIAWSRDHR